MLLLPMISAASGQVSSMLGEWVTVDDKTGEQRSVVNLYQGKDGLYYGAISKKRGFLGRNQTWIRKKTK